MAKPSLSQQLDELVDAILAQRDFRAESVRPPADPRVAALLRIAAELRNLPREDFRARLKTDLERRASMTTTAKPAPEKSKAKPIPEGYHTVSPYLHIRGAASAIEFYKKALGATEVMRLRIPDGRLGHAEIQIGDSRIMLSDEFPEYGHRSPESFGGSPVLIHLDVPDVDALAAQVSAAGLKVTVVDQDYGDRTGGFTDPFGHKWIISTHKEDVTFAEYLRRQALKKQQTEGGGREETKPATKPLKRFREGFHTATAYLTVADGVRAVEFYKKAFGAAENEPMRFVDPSGRFAHAEFTVGDSLIMLNDESKEYGKRGPLSLGGSPVTMHLYVDDVDAVAAQAVAAGAKVLMPVEDHFHGDRAGRFEDPFGHVWIISTHIEDVSAEEIERRAEAFMKRQGAPAARKEEPAPAAKPVNPIREGFHTVTPYLHVASAAGMIDFVKKAFGATELFRSPSLRGGVHAEVRIGDSVVMIGGHEGMPFDEMPVALHLYVNDADAVYKRALEAGATSIYELIDQDYGDREGSVKDPFGNNWYIATHKLTGKPIPEGLRSVTPYLHPRGAARLIDFLKQAFEAEEIARYEEPGGTIVHAKVRIGDSMVEMGEAHGPFQPMPATFYLYVTDVDALYNRAVQAGATSKSEPADQPYGDRNAGVTDPFGNVWYIATHIKDVPM